MSLFDPHGVRALTLDEYIATLQALRDANPGSGGWPVQKWSPAKARHAAPAPMVAFENAPPILSGSRKVAMPAFWQEGYDAEANKGDPVVRV